MKTGSRHQEIIKMGAEINKIEREDYKELMNMEMAFEPFIRQDRQKLIKR